MIQASKTRTTTIGIQGENKARVIAFDVSDILAEFPGASFTLIHQRRDDTSAYPVSSTELSGNLLLWTVTSADTAMAGSSYCELIATVDDVIVKTVIYSLQVIGALDNTAEPPDPWESWVQDVVDAADRADAAAALLENPGAQAETLEAGASATAAYANGVFTFGIPRGAAGRDGTDGTNGRDGTDGKDGKDGTDGKDGKDGQDGAPGQNGQDGVSPVVAVTDITGGHRVTITDAEGDHTFDVMDGTTPTEPQWELIKEVTTTEDLTEIKIETDSYGEPFKLSEVIAVFSCGVSTTGARDSFYGQFGCRVHGAVSDGSTSFPSFMYASATSTMGAKLHIKTYENAPVEVTSIVGVDAGNTQNIQSMPKNLIVDYITYIKLYQSNATKSLIPSGANMILYGKRKGA